MEGISDNVSYLCPRVPSVCFGKRYFEAGKTNLLSRFEHGQHANISKNGKVKVYLRIKPSKDAAQMLAPPQASDIHVFCVCWCVEGFILQGHAAVPWDGGCSMFPTQHRGLICKGRMSTVWSLYGIAHIFTSYRFRVYKVC